MNIPIYSQEEEYASVGHGIGQSQDSTAHNSITQVEDRHTKRGLSFKLWGKKQEHTMNLQLISTKKHNVLCYFKSVTRAFTLTSVKRMGFFPSAVGRNSSFSSPPSGSSNLGSKYMTVNWLCLCLPAKSVHICCRQFKSQMLYFLYYYMKLKICV